MDISSRGSIMVVDDDPGIRNLMATILRTEGYEVEAADNAEKACAFLASREFDLVFSDLYMPDGPSGMNVLQYIRENNLNTPGVIVTGFGSMDTAVQALRLQAFDYVTKPFHAKELIDVAERAIDSGRRRNGVSAQRRQFRHRGDRNQKLIGKSDKMQALETLIERVAPSSSTVLIRGESGTGKELVARALHRLSPRADRPLIPVNCGAIPEDLLESELFGHVRGAFTGAVANRLGRFVLADKGTIFLDEIGDMSPKLQVKVLRVLQEQELEPVGSTETIRVNVRVVAATNVDLERAVAERRFREDLYYRLNVIPIEVPPLRDRISDLSRLVRHFVRAFNRAGDKRIEAFAPETTDLLEQYDWPGNVRELENLVERMSILARNTVVQPEDLPAKFHVSRRRVAAPAQAQHPVCQFAAAAGNGYGASSPAWFPSALPMNEGLSSDERFWIRSPHQAEEDLAARARESEEEGGTNRVTYPLLTDAGVDLSALVDDFEREMILRALDRCEGVKSRAAELLGIKRTTLVEKMKKKDIVFEK